MGKFDDTFKQLIHAIETQGYEYKTESRPDETFKQIDASVVSYDLRDKTLPLLTIKEVEFKKVFTELLWFLKGNDNVDFMVQNGCNIWNKDAYSYYKRICDLHDVKKMTYKEFLAELKEEGSMYYDRPIAYELGDTGNSYPRLWRHYDADTVVDEGIDQIDNLVKGIIKNPYSRRHIVTAWNPSTLDDVALSPCHTGFSVVVKPLGMWDRFDLVNEKPAFKTSIRARVIKDNDPDALKTVNDLIKDIPDKGISLYWDQRSVDVFLGLPYNMASYATLTYLLAEMTGTVPMKVTGFLKNVHLYSSHRESVQKTKQNSSNLAHPKIQMKSHILDKIKSYVTGSIDMDQFTSLLSVDDMSVLDYKHQGKVPAKMIPEKQ